MIYAYLNETGFEYDIYNLLRSFLPRAEVRFLYPAGLEKKPEGAGTAKEALTAYRGRVDRAERDLARWREEVAGRQARGESTGGEDRQKPRHANSHARSSKALEEKLAGAREHLQALRKEEAEAFLLVRFKEDSIRLRWEPDGGEAARIFEALALAEGREPAVESIIAGLLSESCGRLYEETLCTHRKLPVDAGQREADLLCRREQKNALKRLIYRALAEDRGQELPWGTLSGIRPTKILLKKLASGASFSEASRWMKEVYLISDKKLDASARIVRRELDVLRRIHTATGIGGMKDGKKGYSLYLNIPFCPSTCLYCSFTSYPEGSYAAVMGDYIRALEKEIDYVREDFQDKKGRVLDSIYIGGGTPTSLSPELMDRLLSYIEQKLDLSQLREWTLEAGRPDSVTEAKLDAIREHGVTRISINPQTMKDETLKLIGRRHTAEETRRAYALARAKGFDNINMDLIIGLPGESLEDLERTLREVMDMGPENLTVHSLALKRTARLNRQWETYEKYRMESSDQRMELAAAYAREMGLTPYYLYRQKNIAGNQENVGYAKEGRECIYNIAIMEEQQDIVALGCAADSKKILPDGSTDRCENVKNIEDYIARVDEMIDRKRALFGERD